LYLSDAYNHLVRKVAPSGTIYSLASKPHQQQVYNFNVQVDRRIGSNMFSVGYTGSLGRHLLWERNINPVPLGSNFLNLNPQNKNPVNTSALPTPRFELPSYTQLDLRAANRWQLIDAGVPETQIDVSDLCTACRTDLFFSYRKEHVTGRMLAVVGIR